MLKAMFKWIPKRDIGLSALLALAALIAATSCAHGPATKAQGLETLNGANYEGTEQPRPPALPFVKRRPANSVVSGILQIQRDGVPAPLSGVRVELVRDGVALAETKSGPSGSFQISAEIPNGRCELRIISDRYRGSLEVSLQGFSARGLQLEAQAK